MGEERDEDEQGKAVRTERELHKLPPHAPTDRTIGEITQRAVLIQLLHNQHYSLFLGFSKCVVVRFSYEAKVSTYQETA